MTPSPHPDRTVWGYSRRYFFFTYFLRSLYAPCASENRGGQCAPPLVEVNQAILARSFNSPLSSLFSVAHLLHTPHNRHLKNPLIDSVWLNKLPCLFSLSQGLEPGGAALGACHCEKKSPEMCQEMMSVISSYTPSGPGVFSIRDAVCPPGGRLPNKNRTDRCLICICRAFITPDTTWGRVSLFSCMFQRLKKICTHFVTNISRLHSIQKVSRHVLYVTVIASLLPRGICFIVLLWFNLPSKLLY